MGDSNKKEDSFSIVFQDSSKSGKEEEGELDPVQEEEEYSESERGFFKKERRSGDLDDDETKDSRFSEDESKSCEDALRSVGNLFERILAKTSLFQMGRSQVERPESAQEEASEKLEFAWISERFDLILGAAHLPLHRDAAVQKGQPQGLVEGQQHC